MLTGSARSPQGEGWQVASPHLTKWSLSPEPQEGSSSRDGRKQLGHRPRALGASNGAAVRQVPAGGGLGPSGQHLPQRLCPQGPGALWFAKENPTLRPASPRASQRS